VQHRAGHGAGGHDETLKQNRAEQRDHDCRTVGDVLEQRNTDGNHDRDTYDVVDDIRQNQADNQQDRHAHQRRIDGGDGHEHIRQERRNAGSWICELTRYQQSRGHQHHHAVGDPHLQALGKIKHLSVFSVVRQGQANQDHGERAGESGVGQNFGQRKVCRQEVRQNLHQAEQEGVNRDDIVLFRNDQILAGDQIIGDLVADFDPQQIFAGKIHAILCRGWKSRVKGRDLYDYIFYLSKGIKVEVQEQVVKVDVALNIRFGYAIPEVSTKVQERVKSAIENMTGLEVSNINVRIAGVNLEKRK